MTLILCYTLHAHFWQIREGKSLGAGKQFPLMLPMAPMPTLKKVDLSTTGVDKGVPS